jgi:hypothetical protein
MKHFFIAYLSLTLLLTAQEKKKLSLPVDDWQVGAAPDQVLVVSGKVEVIPSESGKALAFLPSGELAEDAAQLGESAAGSAVIQCRAFASKQGRSVPRFGISVHGGNGYRLCINPSQKQLELRKGADEIVSSVSYAWSSDVWLNLKLAVVKGQGDAWSIQAYVWPASDATPPVEPQLKHEDKNLKGQGKSGIFATLYSGKPVLFDDIQIEIDSAPAS